MRSRGRRRSHVHGSSLHRGVHRADRVSGRASGMIAGGTRRRPAPDAVGDDALVDTYAPAPTSTSSHRIDRVTCAPVGEARAAPGRVFGRPACHERERRRPVVVRRADVPERGVADRTADAARARGDQPVVDAADRVRPARPPGSDANTSGCADLHADEVIRAFAPAPRGAKPVTRAVGVERTPPYSAARGSGTSASVTSAPDAACASASAREVDVGQRVAVDDEERVGADDAAAPAAVRRRCRARPAAPRNSARGRRGRCRRRRRR